ncbi:MAG TPA: S1 RNA-binding domain-containing protein [Methylomirabilota bacterium]|nr:S1 RNA-binding domain-containing protein [Methylomirabilota bacterium]
MNTEQERSAPTEDFASLFAHEESGPALSEGQVVKGRVVQISADSVFVDIQEKGEGIIARAELEDHQGNLEVGVDDEVEATVISTDGEIRLSRKLLKGMRARAMLENAVANGLPVEGKVVGVIKGGYEVTVAGVRAFCPFSQIDVRRVESSDAYLNQVLEFRVTRYGDNGRNIVLSRRQLLEERAKKAAEETRQRIVPGAVLSGTVSSLTDFGAFVDLGGVQGLVHVSELSHSRAVKPADVLQVGQEVSVKVLKIDDKTGKIALSMKALEGDPWAAAPTQLRERQIVRGRIVRAMDFGVFVELLPGVDGLLHMSEVPRSQQGRIKEAAEKQEEITVLILGIDPDKKRISLALAPEGSEPGGQLESSLSVGSVVTGTVDRVEPFGVFVRVGPGQVGLIPNAEMGTQRGADHRKEFAPGTEVKVVVLGIEDNGKRIRLSRAKALAREEQAETQAYLKGSQPKGRGFGVTLGDLLRQSRKN